jgi:hypothetical protein
VTIARVTESVPVSIIIITTIRSNYGIIENLKLK